MAASAAHYVLFVCVENSYRSQMADLRLDWNLPDPKHLPREEARRVRDEVRLRVTTLLADLSTD